MRKVATSLAVSTTAVMGLATPASAANPTGGCPPVFDLQAISAFGPGFEEFLVTVDKNADQFVCAKPLPEALPFPNINFVDNVVRR
jgi:hypothetical protein